MSSRSYVIGVGMTNFDRPGTKQGDFPQWAQEAGEKALADAGVPRPGGPAAVEGAEVALQHNIGLGGAAVVTIYRKAA